MKNDTKIDVKMRQKRKYGKKGEITQKMQGDVSETT